MLVPPHRAADLPAYALWANSGTRRPLVAFLAA